MIYNDIQWYAYNDTNPIHRIVESFDWIKSKSAAVETSRRGISQSWTQSCRVTRGEHNQIHQMLINFEMSLDTDIKESKMYTPKM